MRINEEFWKAVMELDGHKCACPFCMRTFDSSGRKKKNDLAHRILDVHHLLGKKHEKPEEGITLCRRCHDECENGLWFHKRRITGREHEIAILEHIKENQPDHFRWGAVLEEFYKKRKVV